MKRCSTNLITARLAFDYARRAVHACEAGILDL